MFKPLCIAFSMFSKIPVANIKWSEKNMALALCFFPVVGFVIGLFYLAVFKVSDILGFNLFLKGALLMAVPIIITGGIHADGFIDTADALSSYSERERKLEILKDPHAGAFGIIWSVIYFILYAAFSSQITKGKAAVIVALGFVLSRALSGIIVLTMKNAKNQGSLNSFTKDASKKTVLAVLLTIGVLTGCCFIIISPVLGGITVFSVLIWVFFFRSLAFKNFGGMTGDLAGFFLQICEIIIVLIISGGGLWI